jgi:hypothetical protein
MPEHEMPFAPAAALGHIRETGGRANIAVAARCCRRPSDANDPDLLEAMRIHRLAWVDV